MVIQGGLQEKQADKARSVVFGREQLMNLLNFGGLHSQTVTAFIYVLMFLFFLFFSPPLDDHGTMPVPPLNKKKFNSTGLVVARASWLEHFKFLSKLHSA